MIKNPIRRWLSHGFLLSGLFFTAWLLLAMTGVVPPPTHSEDLSIGMRVLGLFSVASWLGAAITYEHEEDDDFF